MEAESGTKRKVITFTVNGTAVETDEPRLKVRQILTLAGLDPDTHYLVEKQGQGHEVEYRNLEEELRVHEHETFLAFFTGPTPVS